MNLFFQPAWITESALFDRAAWRRSPPAPLSSGAEVL